MPQPEQDTSQLILVAFVKVITHCVQGFGHGSQAFDVRLVNNVDCEQLVTQELPSKKYPSTQVRHYVSEVHVRQGLAQD
jgi:hypothetical protein